MIHAYIVIAGYFEYFVKMLTFKSPNKTRHCFCFENQIMHNQVNRSSFLKWPLYLSYDITDIQWLMSCHNVMTTRYIALSMRTSNFMMMSVTTIQIVIEINKLDQSCQIPYIFNVKIHPRLEQRWLELKTRTAGQFFMYKRVSGLNQY